MKITRIRCRNELSFTDSDGVLYYLCEGTSEGFAGKTFGDTINNKNNYSFSINDKNYTIVKYSIDKKNNSLCKFMVYNCIHLNINSCRCKIKICVTIFDKYIRVQYQSKDITHNVKIVDENFDIENISFPHLTDKNILYLIDIYGKLYVCEIKLENDELIFSKIDCELEIKTKKKDKCQKCN